MLIYSLNTLFYSLINFLFVTYEFSTIQDLTQCGHEHIVFLVIKKINNNNNKKEPLSFCDYFF